MYKHILVPVAPEHRATTEQALAAARQLADEGASITALTVIEAIPGFVAYEIPDDLMRNAQDKARTDLEALVGEGIETAVVTGHAARTIVDFASEKGADCIVVASHRPGLSDYFLGSTASHVVRHAPCAVHVVR